MAELIGMNVEVINGQVVPGLKQQSTTITQTIATIDKLMAVVQANWKGHDAKQFADKWNSDYKSKLRTLAQELQQLAVTAQRNASKQSETSSAL